MTPAARVAAAIEVLDRILAGTAPELALTAWGRANRFAGSGDRNAIRDHVFAALRCRSSFAALGGGLTGRGLMLGAVRASGQEVAAIFSGEGHAPPPVQDEPGTEPDGLAALDCPDWLGPRLQAALGADFAPVLRALQARAPVFLRVNSAKTSLAGAQAALAAEGIATEPVAWVKTALEVTGNARKVQTSQAYMTGLVELQDAASQAVVEALYLTPGAKVLDYCAGGGGKALALAARGAKVWAHDASPARMSDLPTRATRAGLRIMITQTPDETKPYDVILTDVPCSGSGSWRRDPAGKWALTEARLTELGALQAQIMDRVAPMVRHGGTLAYVTCSLLAEENEAQIAAFQARHPAWTLKTQRRFSPLDGGDGFFLAILTRN
ncbi:RsmB/NOP family class I SAM-dependent RNA methyltransferase [bacterium]|nr:RsmB/NOP family class I SAM-dependent RNA methyltransferase [bacterium]